MLEVGFPVDARGDDNGTPLDRAAVRGYADIVEVLLAHNPSLEVTNDFGGTPLGGAVWGAGNFPRSKKATIPKTVDLLAAIDREPKPAGIGWQDRRSTARFEGGREDVAEVLRRHGGRASAEFADE